MACEVCTLQFGAERVAAPCAHCGYASCRPCLRTYLLSRTTPPACMACRRPLSDDHLEAMLPKTFVRGQLRKHLAGAFVDAERAQLAAAQPYARLVRDLARMRDEAVRVDVAGLCAARDAARSAYEEHLRRAGEKMTAKERRNYLYARRFKRQRLAKANAALSAASAANTRHQRDIAAAYGHMRSHPNPTWLLRAAPAAPPAPAPAAHPPPRRAAPRAAAAAARPTVLGPCPRDGCRGFLGGDGACGTCAGLACAECLAPRGEGAPHECDPGALASVRAIRADSRPCPSCAAFIHRISGCSQMWCTHCNTPFDWTTGARVDGPIHNPHAFEYFARRGAGAGAGFAAGECPGDVAALERAARERNLAPARLSKFLRALAFAAHVENVTLPAIRGHASYNLDLRVKYLVGAIDDAEFRSRLAAREKDARKRRAIVQYYELIPVALRSLAREFAAGELAPERVDAAFSRFANFANRIARGIGERYGTKLRPPHIRTRPVFDAPHFRYETRRWPRGK